MTMSWFAPYCFCLVRPLLGIAKGQVCSSAQPDWRHALSGAVAGRIRDWQPGFAGECRLTMVGSDEFARTQHERTRDMECVQGPAAGLRGMGFREATASIPN